jgi:hypothetical protein
MRYTDKIIYEAFGSEWTRTPDFSFVASVVASETDVLNAMYKNTHYDAHHMLYVERLGTNAVRPCFNVYRPSYSGVLYYIRPKEES